MSVPTSGRTYGDADRTPVPLPAYRCKSTAQEARPHAPHSTLTHQCKVTIDHDGPHHCICGKSWPRAKGVGL